MIILISLITIFSYQEKEIDNIRSSYLLASSSEANCNKLGEILNKRNNKSSPLIIGYKGCYYLIKCKFIKNPINKVAYFKKGRRLLEYAIKKHPTLVELRFIRYTVQIHMPKYLMYHNSIEKDISFVENNIESIKDQETQDFITSSLNKISK
tara:strand:- start:62 stop:517 length:456 start_codon:yes stop_codon:yes gene_type:complete